MTPCPLCAGLVQQALPDVLPDGTLAVKPDGIDLLYLDGAAAAPAAHPQKMPSNFGQPQRGR
jgi:hypothetical protein